MKHSKYNKSFFIFRRDLRLQDNSGLMSALECSKKVIPCFIFTPEQIQHNPYRGNPSLQFMLESLSDLNAQLKEKGSRLYHFWGEPDEIARRCISECKIDAIFVNRDYTPYSQRRDQRLSEVCKDEGVDFFYVDDALLQVPEDTLKADGKPYSIFTPYFRNAFKIDVKEPLHDQDGSYFNGEIAFAKDETFYETILPERSLLALKGGRSAGMEILNQIRQCDNYDYERDFPALQATTHLSAHLKFTTISPREAYYAIVESFGKQHALVRSLYWRDFFSGIALFYPHVFTGAFHQKYDQLKWENDDNAFKRWCDGETGFPIVDAGMRELNQTGLMHNRVRMITASFLTKDLHIDWRQGEKYFAQKLIDYDPAVNNGNWQWCASTGCDAQPYFRIFNPWNQQLKFDADCLYIKTWIPELRDVSPKAIHHWYDEKSHRYPTPMVEHASEAQVALRLYKNQV